MHAAGRRTRGAFHLCLTEGDDAIEPERTERRDAQRHMTGDVAECIAAFVAIAAGVRQFTRTDAVHDDDNGSRERRHRTLT